MSDSITISLANRDDTRAKVCTANMFDLGDDSYESQPVIIGFASFTRVASTSRVIRVIPSLHRPPVDLQGIPTDRLGKHKEEILSSCP